MANQGGNGLMYVLIGCAGLCFLALCGATGFGVYLLAQGGITVPGPTDDPYGGGPPPGGPQPPFGPGGSVPAPTAPVPTASRIRVTATVASVAGSVAVPQGASCVFDVQLPSQATPVCRTQVVCGEQLVYGGEDAGYFPCTVSPGSPPGVSGGEQQTTGTDGDAAMTIDTSAGMLSVADDAHGPHGAFALEARIVRVE